MKVPRCTHYQISLTINPEPAPSTHKLYGGTIAVDCLITIENYTPEPRKIIPFLLYRMLSVEQACDTTGEELIFTQAVVSRADMPRQQVNAVQIVLPHPLSEGAVTQIRLKYHGPVCGYPEVWPYVQDHVSQAYTLLRREVLWFPVIADYSTGDSWRDSFNFDLSITVPDRNLIAVANGQTGEMCTKADRICYHWQTSQPDNVPRLTVACAPFQRVAITPQISLYYLPDDEIGAQVVAKAMKAARCLCTDWFGPLPACSLNIVEIPDKYGSEASAYLILQEAASFKAATVDDPQAYQQALKYAGHEMIHLWNAPSVEQYVSRFLDEGTTHYIEALLLKEEIGVAAYWERMEAYRRTFLAGGEAVAAVPLAEAGQHMNVRDIVARSKGPWFMCFLHHLVGDSLLTALGCFYAQYRHCGANLEDFQATISQSVGIDLSHFFREWLWQAESATYLAQNLSAPELVAGLIEAYK